MSQADTDLSPNDVSSELADAGIMISAAGAYAVCGADDPRAVIDAALDEFDSGDSLDQDDIEPLLDRTSEDEDEDEDEEGAADEDSTDDGTPESEATEDDESNETADEEDAEEDAGESDSDGAGIDREVAIPEDAPDGPIGDAELNVHGEPQGGTVYERWPRVCAQLFKDERPDIAERSTEERSVEIQNDITDQSTCTGTFDDFAELFDSRYEKIKEILRGRVMPQSIESIQTPYRGGEDVAIVGMVRRVWTTQKGNRLVEVEDPTGVMRAVYTDEEEMEKTERVIEDEVVAIEGQLSDDAGIIFGDELHFPDVPYSSPTGTADRSVKAAFISDVHLGADTFAYDKWNDFIDWIRQQDDIEYLLVGGDLVEGIGVYPDQDEELDVVDIKDQYRLCAESFREMPDDLEIISIVGNHDTGTRLAEPQPTIREEFRELFPDNVTIVGNPVMVNIEGVDILMYHGMSIHPLADHIPGKTQDEPTGVMELMLEKRHLAPMYGQNVRLAPEQEDYLVIDEVPDVLHCGHVHKFGAEKFRDVTMFNTSCWQYQTDFQKSKDIQPDVGYVTVMDLSTHEYEVKQF